MNRKVRNAALSALLLSAALVPAIAQKVDNTKKVNRDINRAEQTLSEIKDLGKQIKSQHQEEIADARRAARRASSVRITSETETTKSAKKANKKSAAKTRKTKKSKTKS